MATNGSARAEWGRYWTLPLAAGLGYATSVIHIYGASPYLKVVSAEFGWSRAEMTFGLTIATVIQAFFGVLIGLIVDRIGPRPLALVGVVLTAAAFALFGTADGTLGNWYLLWAVMAFAVLPVQATVWTSAVASRFAVSRGMALAVTLCGASLAQFLFPLLGTALIAAYGWREAFAWQAAICLAVALPPIFLLFRGAHDRHGKRGETVKLDRSALSGVSIAEGLRSSIYWRLMLAALLFTFTIVALSFHFQPILTDGGMSDMGAARIASAIGLSSIFGRLGTGFLLDRLRPSLVGAAAFLLPVAGCLVLLGLGTGPAAAMLAAVLIGLTLGAEVDVIVYLTTRHFGLKNFGALYGGLMAALSLGTAAGPLAAARVFDTYGDYIPFLWLTILCMAGASLAMLTLPRPAFGGEGG